MSESETLIAHLVENDARGELAFIDRARAVRELRDLLEQETGAPLSATRFAALLRERGYSIDQPTISRLEYAIETLFPVIPVALRSGVGRPAIDRIRKLDKILVTFLEGRGRDQTVTDEARAWFLACLGRHNREGWRIDPVRDELEAHLTEICGESAGKVRADLDFIERYGATGSDAPVPLTFDPPEPGSTSSSAPSPGAYIVDDHAPGAEIGGSPRVAVAGGHDHEAVDTGADTPGEKPAMRRPAPEIRGAGPTPSGDRSPSGREEPPRQDVDAREPTGATARRGGMYLDLCQGLRVPGGLPGTASLCRPGPLVRRGGATRDALVDARRACR